MSAVDFTPSQLDAIDIEKRYLDACVVAGPGSGKTTVLVEYFKRLVAAGIDPLRILAITFTEKAGIAPADVKDLAPDPQIENSNGVHVKCLVGRHEV